MLDVDDVRQLLRQREVDLVLARAPEPHELRLHAEFDGYGDFFSVLASDVEYLDLPGRMTVADLRLVQDLREAAAVATKWGMLIGRYSGPAIILRSVDANTWQSATPGDLGILVANRIEIQPGADWPLLGT
jgi:DNA-binding transcriptional LysR family regulator